LRLPPTRAGLRRTTVLHAAGRSSSWVIRAVDGPGWSADELRERASWSREPSARLVEPLVLEDARLDEKHDVLGDVLGLVADALELAAGREQIDRALDAGRLAHHLLLEHVEVLAVDRVDLVVAADHVAREDPVAAHEGVEPVVEHAAHDLRHALEAQ